MTKNNLSNAAWKLRATGALVLALALSTFPAAFSRAVKAQAPAKASAQTPVKATTSPAAESKGGPKEGIKVHGHWTIDVRNPDGTLVTHREFENELQPDGANALSHFLARQKTVGEWEIFLDSTFPPCAVELRFSPCILVEPTSSSTADPKRIFKNLLVNAPGLDFNNQPLPNFGKLVLSGTVTAWSGGDISSLTTMLIECPQLGSCALQDFKPFTRVFLPFGSPCPPNTQCALRVVAGQIIQVTVVISFS